MRIKINKELSNYIEKLQYEASRYKDVFNTLQREKYSYISDKEWKEATEYFQTLYAEANLRFNFAKQELYNTYIKDYIKEEETKNWVLNYTTNEIFINETPMEIKYTEQYHNFINRIYVEPKEIRNITF